MNNAPIRWLLPIALLAGCSDDDPQDTPDVADTAVDAVDATTADVGTDTVADVGDDTTMADAEDAGVDTVPDVEADTVEEDTTVRPDGLPQELAFTFEREADGEPLTETEIADFTRELTGFWDSSEYFRWVRMTSHGVAEDNEEGWFSYAMWWQDVRGIVDGDRIIFQHHGRADNITLRSCKVLNNAIAGYLLTGDEDMRWIVENYSRGIAALGMVMHFEEDDEEPYLQARAAFTRNHSFQTVGGREVFIDYDPVRRDEDAWNSAIVHNPTNPYWGDVHFTNQRSKDDLPHMMRSVPMLMRAVDEAPDESVREAAALALEYLQGFSESVVDHEYQILTKFADGEPVIPRKEDGTIKDLASLTLFDRLLPQGECAAKLSIAYAASNGDRLGIECETGMDVRFENVANDTNYFNYTIYRLFHVASAYLALMHHDNETAERLFGGLVERADRMLNDPSVPHRDSAVFEADVAVILVTMASIGVPLTATEARFVQEQYSISVAHYAEFELWDPWNADLEDGVSFDYKPQRGVAVRPTEIAHILEYCASPLRNPSTVEFVDCEVVANRDQWGQ